MLIDFGQYHGPISISGEKKRCFISVIKNSENLTRNEMVFQALQNYDQIRFRSIRDLPTIEKTNKGKPYFPSCDLYLSISTSNDYTVIAIADSEIGVDLDGDHSVKEQSIASRFFHLEECTAANSTEGFFTIWTAKESYVKYTGTGIDNSFSQFSVFSIPEVIAHFSLFENLHLSLCSESYINIFIVVND